MDPELLKILSEELRETKFLIIETRNMTEETRKMTIETGRIADEVRKIAIETRQMAIEARRKADAAWELVVITRNQVQEEIHYLKLPWWKKLSGKAA